MSADQPKAAGDTATSAPQVGSPTSATDQKSAQLPSSPADALDGCLWPVNAVLNFLSDPLQGVKQHLATYAPERLLTRGAIIYLLFTLVSTLISWSVTERAETIVQGLPSSIRHDDAWFALLLIWLTRTVAWFGVVQMVWAAVRLIADAIRSTRRASDDRPAWPPASKS